MIVFTRIHFFVYFPCTYVYTYMVIQCELSFQRSPVQLLISDEKNSLYSESSHSCHFFLLTQK